MASIKSTIELYDRFSAPLLKVASAVSKTEQVMAHMNEQMSRSAGSEKFGEARRQVEETTAAVSKLTGGLSGVSGAAASAGEHIQGGAQAQAADRQDGDRQREHHGAPVDDGHVQRQRNEADRHAGKRQRRDAAL